MIRTSGKFRAASARFKAPTLHRQRRVLITCECSHLSLPVARNAPVAKRPQRRDGGLPLVCSQGTYETLRTLGGYSWEFLVRVCRTVLQILTLFTTKKCHLRPDLKHPYPFSDLAFRQKLCHHYLDQSVNKKNSSNAFRICIFLFRSFIWNENDTH